MDYIEAVNFLENGNAKKSIDFFKDNDYLLEYAYSLFMLGKFDEAKKIFGDIDSRRADWAKKIISIVQNQFVGYPTYFQIRSFLEIDIDMLIKNRQIDFVQQILNYANFFNQINNESYKFFGRVLLKNGYPDGCKFFLDKSKDVCYNDSELQFLYVEYYLFINDIENTKKAIEKCLAVNSEYYPAKRIKVKLGV